jgi:hypothetical protein
MPGNAARALGIINSLRVVGAACPGLCGGERCKPVRMDQLFTFFAMCDAAAERAVDATLE